MRNSSSRKWNGLGTNSSAPISNPSKRCSAVLSAVINIIGTGVVSLMSRASSKPDPSGRPMSRITRSQIPSCSFFSARCLVSTHTTSYGSRSRRSCKVAPSERSSSTSNSRFITGALRAHRIRSSGVREIHLSQEPARGGIGKTDRAVHSPDQLTNYVEPDAAPAPARMPHKQFAQPIGIAMKTVTIVAHPHDQVIVVPALHRHLDRSRLAMRDGILDQIGEHTFQRPRICHDDSISALLDQHVRPVMPQSVDAVAQTDRFEKESAARQVYQEERILQLQLQ